MCTMLRIEKYTLRLALFAFLFAFISCTRVEKQKEETQKDASKTSAIETQGRTKTILFFGNSLTAGYGVEEEDAFPGLIQKKIDSIGLSYKVINGGLSGETTASGLSRLEWFLEEKPDIFVLELGGNDGLRGIQLSETEKNLKKIIELVSNTYPETKLVLAGMQIPPNMGLDYTNSFAGIYPKIASEYTQLTFIPFLLEGVGGDPELNLPDGIHPTEEGHLIIAETVWTYLLPLLQD